MLKLKSSVGELVSWASIKGLSLTPQSKRYLLAFLTGQDSLPAWVTGVACQMFCGSDESPLAAPLEAAAIELMKYQFGTASAAGRPYQGSPDLALIRAMQQDSHLIDAAEALREFLHRLQVLIDSGAAIGDVKRLIAEATLGISSK